MPEESLKAKYAKLDNMALLEAAIQRAHYLPEAQAAIDEVIADRGGLQKLQQELEEQARKTEEAEKIKKLAFDQLHSGKAKEEVITSISASYHSPSEVEELFDEAYAKWEKWEADKKSNPKSVLMGAIGALIGGTIAGILWAMMLSSERIVVLLALGLLICPYVFIWLFSRKSIINIGILVLTILAVAYSLLLGYLLTGFFV